jgi:hypothetical protein
MNAYPSSATPSLEQKMPTAAPAQVPGRSGSLWQRMISSWIRTYELCSCSGTVPFLLL